MLRFIALRENPGDAMNGVSGEYYPYTSNYDTRKVTFYPVVLVGEEEEEVCKDNSGSYGDAYGSTFGECGDWRNY